MTKITILGTAQDGGIPHLNCNCKHCINPKYHRYISSILVSSDGENLLIDSTSDISRQLINSKKSFQSINKILITHLHIGHYLGLLQLGKEAANTDNIIVYSSESNIDFFKENKPFSYLFSRNQIVGKIISTDDGIKIGDCQIKVFEVPHRNEDGITFGVEILSKNNSLMFIPDIDYLDPFLIDKLKSVDYVLFDGSFFTKSDILRQENVPHPPIKSTITILGEPTNKFYFTHFNHNNPILNKGKERDFVLNSGYFIAYDGQVITL